MIKDGLATNHHRWRSWIVSALPTLAQFGQTRPIHYVLAAILVAAAVALRLLIAPQGAGLQYVTFFPAVTLVAIFGGFRPAMAAAVICCGLANYLFFPPVNSFNFSGGAIWSGTVFLADEVVVCGAIVGMQRYYRKYVSTADSLTRIEACLRDLDANEKKLRSLYELSPLGIALTDMNGRYIEFNEAFRRITGYESDELKRLDYWALTPRKYAAEEARQLDALHSTGRYGPYEKEYIRKDGSLVPIELNGMLVTGRDGRPDIWSLVKDLTEDKRAKEEILTLNQTLEQQVRERTSELRSMMDSLPYLTWLKDTEGYYITINKVFADFLGLEDPGQAIGKTDLDLQPKELAEKYRADDGEVMASRQRKHVEEKAFDGKRVFWVETFKTPVIDGHGNVRGTAGFARDITERKEQEEALIAARQEADRANAAKSRFLAATSHDLRQPVQALSLQVGLLFRKFGSSDAPLLREMEHCLSSLTEILDDLLDLSKFDAGAVTPHISTFSVGDVLASVVAMHLPEAEKKNLRLRIVASEVTARTDRPLLERMLGNLVSNAIRYTFQGGVVLGCRRRQGKVWVEVRDTGIGIPPDQVDVIFEEFKQLGNPERNREKGSGLGLAFVKRTADLLGLDIHVSSRPGRGSCFAVELPVGDAADVAPPQHDLADDADHPGRKLRVALVDDDAALREAFVLVLEETGHEVVAAATTKALLAGLGETPPDVLVADYRLGAGETGIDVVASVRAAFGIQIPAIVLTGDTDPDRVREITAHGIEVRHKPLRMKALTECLREMAGPKGG